MKHFIFFLGERDLLYKQLCKGVENFDCEIEVFNTNRFKRMFDKEVTYFDLSSKTVLENYILEASGDNTEISLIISDNLSLVNDNHDDYVTKIEKLLYGTVFSVEALIDNKRLKKLNVIIIAKVNTDEISITDSIYPSLFDHFNRFSLNGSTLNLSTHLIYLVHNTAYSLDSYAKIEFGYTSEDELKLKDLLNKKIVKVSHLIKSVIADSESEIKSGILWIKD